MRKLIRATTEEISIFLEGLISKLKSRKEKRETLDELSARIARKMERELRDLNQRKSSSLPREEVDLDIVEIPVLWSYEGIHSKAK